MENSVSNILVDQAEQKLKKLEVEYNKRCLILMDIISAERASCIHTYRQSGHYFMTDIINRCAKCGAIKIT